ncbi:MAG: hypothetical protein Q9212_004992 [Teloschistes hypoglaucus]
MSANAITALDHLDNTVRLSDKRVAAKPQSRKSSVGKARPIIEMSGNKKADREHTGDANDARSGRPSLSTLVQDVLRPVKWVRDIHLALIIFYCWEGLFLMASQMMPPGRLRKCLGIVEYLLTLVFYLYITLRIILPERLLERLQFGEPPLQQGMQRVRWKCNCGSKLYDDYLELKPGAAALFELALNTPSQQRPSGRYRAAPRQDYALSWPRGSGLPSPGPLLPFSRTPNSTSTSTTIDPNARVDQHSSATTICEQESKWLLVCARAWRRPTSLIHLNVCSTSSDQQLFTELRRSYLQTKAWYHRFSLKVVQSIRFVQAERRIPLPSLRLAPTRRRDLMTHLFHHPHEANEKAITFLRSPKKRKQRLAVCPQAGTNLGWGIHLVEGYAMTRVWSLASGMFLISSMVFAIAWSVLEHDIQGAFAIAAYVVALVGLGVGTLQTYIA